MVDFDAIVSEMTEEIEHYKKTLKKIAEKKPHHAGQTRNEYWFQQLAIAALTYTKKEGE